MSLRLPVRSLTLHHYLPCVSHLLPSHLVCRWPEACKLPASDSFAHRLRPRDARRYRQDIGRQKWQRRDSTTASGFSLSQRTTVAFAALTAVSQFHPWLGGASSVDPKQNTVVCLPAPWQAQACEAQPVSLTPISLSPSLPLLLSPCYHFVILELVSPKWHAVLVFLTIFSTTAPSPSLAILELPHHRSGSLLGGPV